ncbi:hypothetical protein GQ53DRAFT_816964 [Thozetella sp. PMI_491]|nr:hypothetical protein GQ53DRAFT_816964 [Thozetella sp. PMI_491]
MQLKSIVAITFSACLAQAFRLAPGTKDGVYAIQTDESGNEYAEYVGSLNTTQRRDVKLDARDWLGCTNRLMNSGDCDSAVNSLYNYCGSGSRYVTAKMAFVQGSVFAYTCDYSGGQSCSRNEAAACYSTITASCGHYVSGSTLLGNNKNYGYDTVGSSFCGNLG